MPMPLFKLIHRRRPATPLSSSVMAALAVLALLAGCTPRPPPNVLLITVDTLRADRLGSYGYEPAQTPSLDRLAREGVRFDNAQSVAPITMPSHSSIMTGLLPPAHGVRDNGAFALPEEAHTLAERFREAGYQTQAWVSAVVLSRRYGIDQGFEKFDDNLWGEDDPKAFMIRERQAEDTVALALNWLKLRRAEPEKKPFFAWIHLFDPHQPYRAPTWIASSSPTPYDAEIRYADEQLGRLLEQLRETGELDNTIVLMTSDHGESLGEHEEKTHAVFVYRATTHVPLILRYPSRIQAGRVVRAPVSSIDIAPTLLSLAHLPGDAGMQGIDLVPMLRVEGGPHPPQYSESLLSELGFGMAPLYALRDDGHTFIRAPKSELYDLSTDPDELHNLFADPAHGERAAAMDIELQRMLDASTRRALRAERNPMNEETVEMLQSLGYLQADAERTAMSGMDPKDGIVIYNELEQARHLAQEEKWQESEVQLRAILDKLPEHFSARSILAFVLLNQQRYDEARDQYLRLLAQDPSQFRLFGMLGGLAIDEGDLDKAESYFRQALEVSPTFIEAKSQLGLIALMRGDEAAAEDWYNQVLKQDPDFPPVYRRIGDIAFDRENYEAAFAAYERTLKATPQDFRALVQSAASARRSGRDEIARQRLGQAAKARPQSWVPYYNLACMDAVAGNLDAALINLDKAVAHGLHARPLIEADPDWRSLRDRPEVRSRMRQQPEKPGG